MRLTLPMGKVVFRQGTAGEFYISRSECGHEAVLEEERTEESIGTLNVTSSAFDHNAVILEACIT